jgi:hypothetical protein
MDGEYQPLQIQEAPPRGQGETAEGKYWKRFASPVTIQQVQYALACKLVHWHKPVLCWLLLLLLHLYSTETDTNAV